MHFEDRMSQSRYATHGEVAVITLDNPPVNSFGQTLRGEIAAALDRAIADKVVHAVVIIGDNGKFSAGADIREFGSSAALAFPDLRALIAMVEASPKPVVAAIAGLCMGGGLELALGCHYRVAVAGAQIALPEVKLGLLPGAGGTQRLPRVLGLEAAVNMIVSGETVSSEKLRDTALFDALIDGDLATGAVAFATRVAAERKTPPRVRDREVTHADAEAFLQFARNTVAVSAGPFPAPRKCIDAIAASLLPMDEGLLIERELFEQLMRTPESIALRHAFHGERAAAKIRDVPADTPTRPVARVGVIGAGTMGGGITMNFLSAGIPVTLVETTQEALDRGIATIRRNYDSAVKKGRMTVEKLDATMALITPSLSLEALADADLIIEAVYEEIGVKEKIFRSLDATAKPGAILASNTSTLDLDQIAAFTKRPQDVIGLHFFSPANIMRLLEVVRGRATANDVLATAMALAKRIRKTAVISGVCDGFIGNRIVRWYGAQANELLAEGATPAQVDRALEKFGMVMGPFRMADLAGNDIGWAVRKRHYAEEPATRRSGIADTLCEAGRFGQKTGAGWYRYADGKRDAIVDPWVDEMIVAYRREHGIVPRAITDEEIVERCVFAMVNEGARIVAEGIAQRASDVDMVYLLGYGFPAHRGGPLLYADTVGLGSVERAVRRFRDSTNDPFWEPAPLLSELAAAGKTFN
jgi:3-hydroxyacyl-CoA dehydrogenase